ncbi:MAG TPA: cytidine deaminase [Polyangiaceae bacterium]
MPDVAAFDRLVEAARRVREHAYAPYSGFRVGAALECASGALFSGANFENASYGATLCAERAAVASMIAAGERTIRRVAVYAEGPELAMPCGLCRQVLFEFGRDAEVIVAGPRGTRTSSIAALLPEPFIFEVPR